MNKGKYTRFIMRGLKSPRLVVDWLFRKMLTNLLSDEVFLKLLFFIRSGYWMNLKNPKTFNEKLNWMKLHLHNPVYSEMADKFAVKKMVAGLVGKEYVVENFSVTDSWDEIDFDNLPNQFVIKCTHDSGGAYVCRDKSTFDFKGVRKKIEKNLRINYYKPLREWPYKNIKPRVIIDQLLDDHTGKELRDYKFWCFDGKPIYMYMTIKGEGIYENFYDMNFAPVNINHGFPRHSPEFEKPSEFEEMKSLAEKLSAGIPFVRVDFFDVDGHVFFGEFTFFDWGAMRPFATFHDDEMLGDLITIP